ncbi:MAG: glycosyltransferase [Planctomycetota bacterium]|nr:glycosyltransferase [Planctomycetota bacterium]MDG2144623.1 glycosyltransferase [Planctomycetota bacterium]
MRIARILTRLNLGGPARQVLASDPQLQQRGHELRVFAGMPEQGEGDLFHELRARGVDVVRVPHLGRGVSPVRDFSALRFLRRELRAFGPDIVHTHASKAGSLGRKAAAGLTRQGPTGAKPVGTVHTFHGHVLEGYFPAMVSRGLALVERRLAASTDRVIAVSHATAADLVRLEVVDKDRLHVVPPGTDMEELLKVTRASVPGSLRKTLGLGMDAILVGVVGRLAEVKQPERAAQIFSSVATRHPEAHLVFIGDGEGRRSLESHITGLDESMQQRIHMVGNIDGQTQIFGDLDLVLCSSRTEGMPIALIEAHAAGIPVVAPIVGGVDEVVAHERTGLLGNDDTELAFGLDTLLGDKDRRTVYGQRARMRVSTRHSAASLASRLEAIYKDVLRIQDGLEETSEVGA